MECEPPSRLADPDAALAGPDRAARLRVAGPLWQGIGAVPETRVRVESVRAARAARAAGVAGHTPPKVLRHQLATALQEGRVDPLVRNVLRGHAAAVPRTPGNGHGMAAVSTHTRPESVRAQPLEALADRPAVKAARDRLARPNKNGKSNIT